MQEKQKTKELQTDKIEKVRVIPIKNIDDFPEHPFQIREDEGMQQLIESIHNYGVISPIVCRMKFDERYEIISGHRRKYACGKLGIEFIPVFLRDLSRAEAIVTMVDSNLQREQILPSERAFAYKMKMNALKCQGQRNDLTSSPLGTKLRTLDLLANECNESRNTIHRYIRLTELIPDLLEKVDSNIIAFRPAVELSYLTKKEQQNLLETIESEDATPSLSQAIRIKKLSQEGNLDTDKIFEIMTEEKANQIEKLKIPMERINKFFVCGTPQKVMEDTIVRALEQCKKKVLTKTTKNRDDDYER